MSFLVMANTMPVEPIQVDYSIPAPVVKAFDYGAPEEHAANLGWRYEDTILSMISVSYLLHICDRGLKKFNMVVGGKTMKASYPFSALLSLERCTAGSQIALFSCTVDPANIIFEQNTMVSALGRLASVFRGSLSHAGVNQDGGAWPTLTTRGGRGGPSPPRRSGPATWRSLTPPTQQP